jgi:hypothetical protein
MRDVLNGAAYDSSRGEALADPCRSLEFKREGCGVTTEVTPHPWFCIERGVQRIRLLGIPRTW